MPRISCGSVELGKVIGYDTTVLRTVLGITFFVFLSWSQTELQQALTLTRAGRFAEAREVIKGVPSPAGVPQQIAFHRLKAAIASGLHEKVAAAEEMEAALALSPQDRSLLLAAAVAEEQAGHVDKAIDLLAKESNPDAKALLAGLLDRGGRHAESISAYREAVRLDPWRAAFRIALGRELIAAGAFDQAASELEQSLLKFPNSAPLLTLSGILQYSGGQNDAGRRILLRAIAADSEYGPAYASLMKIVMDSSEAPSEGERAALCRWDKITCSALELRSARETNDKDLERRSMAALRMASLENPTAACALGQAYAWNDQPQEARRRLETCVRLDPTPQNHYRLAQVYRKLGKTALAQEQLEARSRLLKDLSDQTARAADSLRTLETQIK